MISHEQLEDWFTYHAPNRDDEHAYVVIRRAGLALATAIVAETPEGPDQTAAVEKVRAAVMLANAARACAKRPPQAAAAAVAD